MLQTLSITGNLKLGLLHHDTFKQTSLKVVKLYQNNYSLCSLTPNCVYFKAVEAVLGKVLQYVIYLNI